MSTRSNHAGRPAGSGAAVPPWLARVTRLLPLRLRRFGGQVLQGRFRLVSIVVPVYNVEAYVQECLESLLHQTHRRLEILVIDDGSPDGSAAIAARMSRKDRRIKIISQENGGLGAARNTGVANARGGLLMFVDSDDALPLRAVETLVATQTRTGSDFVIGTIAQWTEEGLSVPPWARRVHKHNRYRTRVEDDYEVIKDVFACNKLFRTKFFKEHVGAFPKGHYEDQAPALRWFRAGCFDVIKDVVYHYRTRADGSSITQDKLALSDLDHREQSMAMIVRELERAPRGLRSYWASKFVGFDMRPYYENTPRADQAYRDRVHSLASRVYRQLDRDGVRGIPISDRLLAATVLFGTTEDVRTMVIRRESLTWKVPGVVVDGVPRVAPEYLEGFSFVPGEEFTDLRSDVKVIARVDDAAFVGDSLVIDGSAYLANIDLARVGALSIEARLIGEEGETELDVTTRPDPLSQVLAADPWNDHLQSGFEIRVPVDALARHADYTVTVTVTADGYASSASLPKPSTNGRGRLPVSKGTAGTHRVWITAPEATPDLLLVRCREVAHQAVDSVALDGSTVTLAISGVAEPGVTYIAESKRTRPTGQVHQAVGAHLVSFNLPVDDDVRREYWTLWRVGPGGMKASLTLDGSPHEAVATAPGPVVAAVDRAGRVHIEKRDPAGEITAIELREKCLRVTGWIVAQDLTEGAVEIVLEGDARGSSAPAVIDADGSFTAELPLALDGGVYLSKEHGFAVVAMVDGKRHWLPCSFGLTGRLPQDLTNDIISAKVTATPKAGSPWIRFRSADGGRARSHYSRAQLIKSYAEASPPVEDAVLFESYWGQQVADSGVAISQALRHRAPHIKQYWTVKCLSIEVPAWATPVVRESEEWFDALARSKYLVNNANFPWYFAKKPGQVYLQTWHGTPLKRIGLDVPPTSLSLTYRGLMDREARHWDFLLAQNEYSSRIFPNAFGTACRVLEVGYPRNDALVSDDDGSARARIREMLGLAPNDRVLLYAPTWRDNAKGSGGYRRISLFDYESLEEGGALHGYKLLYRGHPNTASAPGALPQHVIDVSNYRDVNDLMLASDALVSDYSSIFFDYAVQRKPIYYLVPDLAEYRDTTRGFYVDIAEVAPGPLCMSMTELETAVLRYERDPVAKQAYDDAIDKFVRQFAPMDDGKASDRVCDVVFIQAHSDAL